MSSQDAPIIVAGHICFDIIPTLGELHGGLADLLHGLSLEETLDTAIGVGACTAEKADSTNGVPRWDTLRRRLADDWPKHPAPLHWTGWRPASAGIRIGPHDSA